MSAGGVYCTTLSLVFSWSRVMYNGSLSKFMENSVHDISSCRKPTDAILSTIVDLNALYQNLVPPAIFGSGFAVMGQQRLFTPNTSLVLLYTYPQPLQISPTYDTNSTSGLGPEPASPEKKLLCCVFLVVKLLIRPATSLIFVQLALWVKKVGQP